MNYCDILNSVFFICWTIERMYYYKYNCSDLISNITNNDNNTQKNTINNKSSYEPIIIPERHNTTDINSSSMLETNYILPDNSTHL